MVTVLAGGVGAARFLRGLVEVVDAKEVVAVVNTGDDFRLHGLWICPDLDTVTYTLAGAVDPERGWGLAGESWTAMAALERYGGATWFSLGDRDLATHLYRTQRLSEGAPLHHVAAEIADAWGVVPVVRPVTDDPVGTKVVVPGEGELDFQDWFVRRRHAISVSGVRFAGAEAAAPAPGVLDSIAHAGTVVLAPSNPIVSIAPVLAVPGVREAVAARRDHVVAVSPIVAGRALKGPADRLLADLGHEPSVVGVARLYADLAGTLVVDEADRARAGEVEAEGLRCVVAPSVMHDLGAAARLAAATIGVAW